LLQRFCEAIGLPGLRDDPRFATASARSANRAALNDLIGERLRLRTTAEWVRVLNDAGVPCGPVYAMDEVFADPQVQHLRLTAPLTHPSLGQLDLVRNAVRISCAGPTVRTPAPDPGAHTVPILTDLGFTPDEVADLRSSGALGKDLC
jgi:crotonobetainyl-CoA:carnitine CoA-transferase CaiB-like acyl-CoA transferase